MGKPRAEPLETLPMLPPLPGWIVSAPSDFFFFLCFRCGAARAHLSQVTAAGDVPVALWRDRLALVAAGNCAEMAGRREGPGVLRDALHLTGPGDDPGPAGRLLQQW